MKAAFDWEDNTGSKVVATSSAEWVRASVYTSGRYGRVAAIMTGDTKSPLCCVVLADDDLLAIYSRLYGDSPYVETLDAAKQRVDTVLLEAGYKTLPAHMRTLT